MKKSLTAILLALGIQSFAQTGGLNTYAFLSLPANTRVAALGGVLVSHPQADVQMLLSNPALLSAENHQQLGFTYLGLPASMGQSTVAYAHQIREGQMLGLGIQYLNFGDFEAFDDTGNSLGTFDAAAYQLAGSYAHQLGNFRMGASLKWVQTRLGTYGSSALLTDIGATFVHPEKSLQVGLVIKNMGVQLTQFSETNLREELPMDVQLGITFKPEYMPFRFSFTTYRWIRSGSLQENEGGTTQSAGTFDQIMSHLAIGTELLLNKNFHVRAGYNHQLRYELGLPESRGAAGFSLGFMLRVKAFELSYSRQIYNQAGAGNWLGVQIALSSVFKKSETTNE
ncbi:type IX secretion system protein PorQ [Cytophagales bacterium LB-30]|uniref:Type IX secretion system protein PorQ n=1 Tax=Shiella aurantiaca TaxID=3058365 RepID=A0ABT8F737_9BACT|nr:type IX secretion system protein PorQ [Shiella aurantiaca]MDN4166275.1 type IX secretion system protein PorQ [Shiella aurantiaca]